MITNRFIRPSIRAFSGLTLSHLQRYTPLVEIIESSDDPRCSEIYQLRHKVLFEQGKNSKFDSSHPQVYKSADNKWEIRDDLDEDETTIQYAVRSPTTKELVCSIRTVDGNMSTLEMQRHKWYDVDIYIRQDGYVEWSRLVADKSVRGTNAVPLLYQQSVFHQQDLDTHHILFMVDSKAKKLLEYYHRWTICRQLTKEPVLCDEFEKGRRSHVMQMDLGSPDSFQRMKFNTCVALPCLLGITFMKSYK